MQLWLTPSPLSNIIPVVLEVENKDKIGWHAKKIAGTPKSSNNEFDIFSISEESENQKNIEINQLKKGNNINFMNEIKKIYINPVEFEKFCKEINEKLKL